MTVEAAIVLPLFLFFFLNLGSVIELIRLHGNLEFALHDVGNRMAVYGYALAASGEEGNEGVLLPELKDIAVSYTYINSEIVNFLGEEYLEATPIKGGIAGLQFVESEIFDAEDCVEIVVTYQAEPFSSVAGWGSVRMANRYYGHLWNGYEIPGTEDAENNDVVYVAENGIVYHEAADCTHLQLSVRMVSLMVAYQSRNIDGEKYVPCERCGSDMEAVVYITDEGDRIHSKEDCPGLKRTVHTMPKKEATNYRPCGRCAQN